MRNTCTSLATIRVGMHTSPTSYEYKENPEFMISYFFARRSSFFMLFFPGFSAEETVPKI